MKEVTCKTVLKELSIGFASCEIISDAGGNPFDCKILDANHFFFDIAGLKSSEAVGKKFSELKGKVKTLFRPLTYYAEIAQREGSDDYEIFLEDIERWYNVKVFSTQVNHFVTLLSDITDRKMSLRNEEDILNLSKLLVSSSNTEIDYHYLTAVLCKLSGAMFGVLNIYSEDRKKFTNIGLYGKSDLVTRAAKYLGYDLRNKEWSISDDRLDQIKGGYPVKFENLSKLAYGVIPDTICRSISAVFNLGYFYVVEIVSSEKTIGDFILVFERDKDLLHPSSVSAYANLVGNAISRKKEAALVQQSENNLKNFFNAGLDFHWVLDFKGGILAVNETVKRRLGFDEDELRGQSVLKVHPEEFHSEAAEVISSMLKGSDIPCFVPLKTKSGFQIPVETYVISGVWNGSPALFGISKDISELKISEEKFFKAFNTSPTIIGLSTLDEGVYVEVNQTFYDILGYKPEEVIGKRSVDVIRMDNKFRSEISMKLREQRSIRNLETVVYTKNNRPVNVQLSVEIITIQERSLILAVAIDITERLTAEKDLLLAKESLEQTSRLAKVGSWEVNLAENSVYWSAVTKEIAEVPADFVPDINSVANFYKEGKDRNRILEIINIATEKGESFDEEFRVVTLHGNEKWIRNIIKPQFAGGKCIYLFGTIQDISDRRQAEEVLRESEANLATIIENALESIWSVNTEYEIQFVNEVFIESFLRTFGVRLAKGVNIVESLPPEQRQLWKDRYDRAFRNEHFLIDETIEYGGKTTYIEVAINPINVGGKVVGASVFGKDVTEKKLAEQRLILAKEKAEESDRLKSAFLANMSHEIRTPMNGILGFLTLMKEPDLSEENKAAYINIVTMSGHRLLETINDIIEISKIETGVIQVNMSAVSVAELIGYYNGFFHQQADQKGLEFVVSNGLPEGLHYFISDKNKLDSIISNLIKNAIKFTQSGSVHFGCYIENNRIVFYVKDTGIGIKKEHLSLIFERFVQGDFSASRLHEGSGLGLSIVKAYVELLEGEIKVESKVGEGTIFSFSIPCIVTENGNSKNLKPSSEEKVHKKKIKILIAEDDHASFLYLQKVLAADDVTIIRTTTGEDTVTCAREDTGIAVILMDIKMPGMSGIEATRKIREFNSKIPIIAQTAYSMSGDRDLAADAGCNDFITKPVNRHELEKLVKKYTGKTS
jgi:PAS domain S-box-containing protein